MFFDFYLSHTKYFVHLNVLKKIFVQGIQTRSFSLSLENTGLTQLSSGVTSSIGEANKFSIDLDQGNDLLQVVDNPNKKGRLPTNPAIYHELSQLILPSQISCTCDNSGLVSKILHFFLKLPCLSEFSAKSLQYRSSYVKLFSRSNLCSAKIPIFRSISLFAKILIFCLISLFDVNGSRDFSQSSRPEFVRGSFGINKTFSIQNMSAVK
jgi:hypothetical protein